MKTWLFFSFCMLMGYQSLAQIVFEQGYFLSNEGERVNCLIRNVDWRDHPTRFDYKLSENADIKEGTIEAVKEFGISNTHKFVRLTVPVDRSSEILSRLSNKKEPEFSTETVFLKVFVEGEVNLYFFRENNLMKYFFQKGNGDVQPLVHKTYKATSNRIGTNTRFRQQLQSALNCEGLSRDEFASLEYTQRDLVRIVVRYHECAGASYAQYQKAKDKNLFKLSLRPGLSLSTFSLKDNFSGNRTMDLSGAFGYRLGLEAEFILPFNKNKWSLLFEPTFNHFKPETRITSLPQNVLVDYQSLELPFGVRYYLYLNEHSKAFLNVFYVFDLELGSDIDYERFDDLDIYSGDNLGLGAGYAINSRFHFELRWSSGRELLARYASYNSSLSSLTAIVGYTIN